MEFGWYVNSVISGECSWFWHHPNDIHWTDCTDTNLVSTYTSNECHIWVVQKAYAICTG